MYLELHTDRNCHLRDVRVIDGELIKILPMQNVEQDVGKVVNGVERRSLLRELKLHASALSRVLCYYESNSTIIVARSREGCKSTGTGEGGAGKLKVLVQREGCTGTKSEGRWNIEGRRDNASVDTGVAALTVKGVLHYEGV